MDTPIPSSGREPLPLGRLARAALLTCLAFAGAATAAPCARDDCRNASHDLENPQATFHVRIIDLRDADAADDPAAAVLSDSMAPLLYLTPRVASILDEVFDGALPAASATGERAPEAQVMAEAKPEPSDEDPEERYGPLSQADNADAPFQLPKFQQQMYRTDI